MIGRLFALGLLGACDGGAVKDHQNPDDSASQGDSGSGQDDSGSAEDLEGLDAADITAEVSTEVHTVVTVTWTTTKASQGYVEFGNDADYGLSTNLTDSGTTHSVVLLGLHADTEAHFRVVSVSPGGAELPSADYAITTGSLPPELPALTVTGEVQGWVGGYQVVPIQGTGYAVAIIDDQGQYVWYNVLESNRNVMRALVAYDRAGLVYCLATPQTSGGTDSGTPPEPSVVRRISWDGYTIEDLPLENMDHDFTELPDGTYGAIVVVDHDGEMPPKGDSIVEMSHDGTSTKTIWSAWDDPNLEAYQDPAKSNWSHANGLDYDPGEDVYYISLKELGTIVKVDRQTGQSLWYMNGFANQFTFSERSEVVPLQHQFEIQSGGILIFDNGSPERGYSRAVEFTLDEDALYADQIWEYIRDPSVSVFAKGDVARLSDGETQVVWSSAGEIQDVDEEGNVVWQLDTELGYAMTFVQLVDSLYPG